MFPSNPPGEHWETMIFGACPQLWWQLAKDKVAIVPPCLPLWYPIQFYMIFVLQSTAFERSFLLSRQLQCAANGGDAVFTGIFKLVECRIAEVPRKLLGAASRLHIEAWTCHVVAFSWSLLAALQSLVLICRGYLMMQQFTDCNLTFLVNMAHRYSTMLHDWKLALTAGANGHDMSKIIGIRHTPKIGIPMDSQYVC